jgi:hypothetical protein
MKFLEAFGDNNHDISASEQLWLILFSRKKIRLA